MYDVIVIGGGPGGYSAAALCGQAGLKTALVEKEAVGGTCANWGCVPTKALLKNAEVIQELAKGRTFGFTVQDVRADFSAAHARSRQVVKRQVKRVEALLKTAGVEVIAGTAELTGVGQVRVQPEGTVLTAKRVIVATGGQARVFSGWEVDGEAVITSKEALNLKQPPASIAIIGAGPIGLEFATVWNRYGSKVVVLEAMDRAMPLEDVEISTEAAAQFGKAGISIRTGVRVQTLKKTSQGVEVIMDTAQGPETLEVEKVLVAVGTAPRTQGLGLEEAGVDLVRGCIVVDVAMKSNLEWLYAIGDVTGKMPLAHTASAQAAIAVDAILNRPVEALNYDHIPRCVFGQIEVASVGLTEMQAREREPEVKVAKAAFAGNGKAVAIAENVGFVKVVAAADGKLLGVHMIGPHVTEMIGGAGALVSLGLTAQQISRVVYPHPTLSEAFLEAVQALTGRAVHG